MTFGPRDGLCITALFMLNMEKGRDKKIDVINEVLEDSLLAFPVSSLLISLYQQYQKRGFLTKKQLQGLHAKASKAINIAPGKLATLEAIIKKMPDRFKSEKPASMEADDNSEVTALISDILKKYPEHKRVLFLKTKLANRELISNAEMDELKRFRKLLK